MHQRFKASSTYDAQRDAAKLFKCNAALMHLQVITTFSHTNDSFEHIFLAVMCCLKLGNLLWVYIYRVAF
jgi:hypothetical protein